MQDDFKYPLQDVPDYVAAIQEEAKQSEPPEFATQGEAIGRKKGRKPNKASTRGRSKAKTNSKKKAQKHRARARTTKKAAPKTRPNKRVRVPNQAQNASSSSKPASSSRATAKAAAKAKASAKKACAKTKAQERKKNLALSGEGDPKRTNEPLEPKPKRAKASEKSSADKEETRVPPAHITHNHIYSSAYRKAFAQCPGDREFAKAQAKKAVDYYKLHGCVNSLCGQFNERPRVSRATK